MWMIAVLIFFVSLTSFYATSAKDIVDLADNTRARHMAESMAVYRDGVIRYYNLNPGAPANVPLNTLITANVLPSWSNEVINPAASNWTHYRDALNQRLYVYAVNVPPPQVITEVLKLSQNTIEAGVFRTGNPILSSPVIGDTGIPLPSPADAAIPDGSPVWVAVGV